MMATAGTDSGGSGCECGATAGCAISLRRPAGDDPAMDALHSRIHGRDACCIGVDRTIHLPSSLPALRRIMDREGRGMSDRASVQITDAIMAFVVVVALLALSPIFFEFSAMVSAEADPLSGLILQLVVPLFFVAVIVSVGVSAKRRI